MTTTQTTTTTYRRLRSGALVEVAPSGRATFLTCSWLVRVASGNPEPDSIEDTYLDVECGARVYSLDGAADLEHTRCEWGHVRHAYGSREQRAEEFEQWMTERMEAFTGRDRDGERV
jgi:hypothetical protein